MNKVVASAVAALFAMNVAAFAADIAGTIKSINANAHEITLDNGKTYTVDQSVKLTDFKAGDKVMVSAEEQNGKNVASKVAKAG